MRHGGILPTYLFRSRWLYAIARPSVVCRLSVTFVRPTQAIKIFGNVSTPFGTLAISDLSIKILQRSSQETPSSGELNTRGVAEYNDFGPAMGATSRKRCKIWYKLLLITNRKLHMSFRLVPNSVTLDDLERRNSPNSYVISPNLVAFWADYVKVAKM